MTTAQAFTTYNLSKPPSTGIENYQSLQQIWKQQQTNSFKNFSHWYNNEDNAPTLEAMQKNGCSLPRQNVSIC